MCLKLISLKENVRSFTFNHLVLMLNTVTVIYSQILLYLSFTAPRPGPFLPKLIYTPLNLWPLWHLKDKSTFYLSRPVSLFNNGYNML